MNDKGMPVLLIAPGSMTLRDIKRAETLGGICIIECKEPEATRFVDAPLGATLDDQARAAMWLVRFISEKPSSTTLTVGEIVKFFVHQLIHSPAPGTIKPVKRAPAAPPPERTT